MGCAGLQIRFGATETPFGPCWLAATPNGICHLQFLNPETELSISAYLRSDFKQSEFIPDDLWAESVCERIFQPLQPSAKPLSIQVQGTDFQCQVWRKLLEIPFGEVTTYQQLAHKLNRPTAARAIGNVVGRNPIAYVIPCHRVIRTSGELGGYCWELARKAEILGWEAGQTRLAISNEVSSKPN